MMIVNLSNDLSEFIFGSDVGVSIGQDFPVGKHVKYHTVHLKCLFLLAIDIMCLPSILMWSSGIYHKATKLFKLISTAICTFPVLRQTHLQICEDH